MQLKQLISVQGTDEASSSQLWFNLANIAVTSLYMYIGIRIGISIGIDANDAQMIESFTWLTLVYAGIVTGNKFANTLANLKFGGKKDDNPPRTTE